MHLVLPLATVTLQRGRENFSLRSCWPNSKSIVFAYPHIKMEPERQDTSKDPQSSQQHQQDAIESNILKLLLLNVHMWMDANFNGNKQRVAALIRAEEPQPNVVLFNEVRLNPLSWFRSCSNLGGIFWGFFEGFCARPRGARNGDGREWLPGASIVDCGC